MIVPDQIVVTAVHQHGETLGPALHLPDQNGVTITHIDEIQQQHGPSPSAFFIRYHAAAPLATITASVQRQNFVQKFDRSVKKTSLSCPHPRLPHRSKCDIMSPKRGPCGYSEHQEGYDGTKTARDRSIFGILLLLAAALHPWIPFIGTKPFRSRRMGRTHLRHHGPDLCIEKGDLTCSQAIGRCQCLYGYTNCEKKTLPLIKVGSVFFYLRSMERYHRSYWVVLPLARLLTVCAAHPPGQFFPRSFHPSSSPRGQGSQPPPRRRAHPR